jgi:hypothetical protein
MSGVLVALALLLVGLADEGRYWPKSRILTVCAAGAAVALLHLSLMVVTTNDAATCGLLATLAILPASALAAKRNRERLS